MSKGKKYTQSYRYGCVRLCKRAGSGIWYVCFADPSNGRWREFSTGTTLKDEAEKFADQWSERVVGKELNIIDENRRIKEVFDRYLEDQLHLKHGSLRRLKTTVNGFNRWLGTRSERVRIKDVDPALLKQFRKHRLEVEGVEAETVDGDISNLGTVFRWAMREKLMVYNPADTSRATGQIRLLKRPVPEKPVYTQKEVDTLIQVAHQEGNELTADLIVAFANTGARFEEIAHLEVTDLDWNRPIPTLTIRAKADWSPKDPREIKTIPMLPQLQEVMRRRCKGHTTGRLFLNSVKHRIAENETLERLKRLFDKADMAKERQTGLHWHAFRRFFVKKCMEAGIPLNVLMKWTGHDSIGMALLYAPAQYTDSAKAMLRLMKPEDAAQPQDDGTSYLDRLQDRTG